MSIYTAILFVLPLPYPPQQQRRDWQWQGDYKAHGYTHAQGNISTGMYEMTVQGSNWEKRALRLKVWEKRKEGRPLSDPFSSKGRGYWNS